jgi:CheY-like chemotaxis protein
MNDFISKPATFDKIVNIISQWATADTGKKKSKDDMMSQNIPKPKDSKQQKPTAKPILVVDDNIINQTLLKNLLKKQGYESVLASTGPEVLDKFKPNEFELILMDLTLPLISGIEVTKKIRQQEASLNVPQTVIVGLSAHTDEKTIESAKQAGMNDYLTKPASMEKIYLLINKWIDK